MPANQVDPVGGLWRSGTRKGGRKVRWLAGRLRSLGTPTHIHTRGHSTAGEVGKGIRPMHRVQKRKREEGREEKRAKMAVGAVAVGRFRAPHFWCCCLAIHVGSRQKSNKQAETSPARDTHTHTFAGSLESESPDLMFLQRVRGLK